MTDLVGDPTPETKATDAPAERPTIKAGTEELFVEAYGNFQEGDVKGYVPSLESDQIRVSVDAKAQFEGPFDLLLHLIDKHAIDVFDIPIKLIVVEYMQAIDTMRDLNLDIAGEFLLMAAQLAHIKSKMLLPKEERPKEGEAEADPRADLVRRLLEYQRFKDVAQRLDQLPMLGRDVFPRYAPIVFDGDVHAHEQSEVESLNLAPIDVFDLIRLLDLTLRRQQKVVIHEVLVERISVGARINEVIDLLASSKRADGYSFASLCDAFGPRTKRGVIVTFLSVLEMTRLRLVRVAQSEDGHIFIHPVEENLDTSDVQAIAAVDDYEKKPSEAMS